MRCGSAMGWSGAEEEALGKLLSPRKNNNRLRHRSIIASNRSSTPNSCNKRSNIAGSPISVNSYLREFLASFAICGFNCRFAFRLFSVSAAWVHDFK
jgi:hypothetical protein